ncbi:MAG: hypothetical protein P8X68_03905 [Desulfobacterales bacterium]
MLVMVFIPLTGIAPHFSVLLLFVCLGSIGSSMFYPTGPPVWLSLMRDGILGGPCPFLERAARFPLPSDHFYHMAGR